jgi:cbb3-type cytochrome oxidase subunit 3
MAWLLLESLLALAVLVAIVAWTMGPQRRRRADPAREKPPDVPPE